MSSSFEARPLVLLTQFKSGTWLTRRIIESLCPLTMIEPDYGHAVGLDATDPDHIFHRPGCYYSWHAIPVPAVQDKLRAMNARVILQIRNIHDLAVSQYHHYADNIDREFNRGAGRHDFFGALDRDFGLSALIAGYNGDGFILPGFGQYLQQISLMIQFAANNADCVLLTYEDLVRDRATAANRIAALLGVTVSAARQEAVTRETGFKAMREQGKAHGTVSHFRKGAPFSHGEELNERHAALMRLEMARHAPELPSLAMDRGLEHILTYVPATCSPVAADAGRRELA